MALYPAGISKAETVDFDSTFTNFGTLLKMGGTQFINASRNLSNIGTVGCGAIITSGLLTAQANELITGASNPYLQINKTDATARSWYLQAYADWVGLGATGGWWNVGHHAGGRGDVFLICKTGRGHGSGLPSWALQ